jgi:1-phosphofructokinase family hexose kinase
MRKRLLVVAGNPAVDRAIEVDHLTVGGIHRPILELALPGGKGINAARAAKSLGADVTVVAIVGGHSGAWIVDGLAAEGIDAKTWRVEIETRTCLSVIDQAAEGQLTEFYERGQPVPAGAWQLVIDFVEAELGKGDVGALLLSGSLAPGSPSDTYASLVDLANGAGVPALIDASGPPLIDALRRGPALVKINLEEAAAARGERGTPLEAVGWLVDEGADRAVVTLGADGAVALERVGAAGLRVAPATERGRYPVGSGDAFMAGVSVSIIAQDGFAEALRAGTAAGIANALRPGAGRLDADAFTRLRATIAIESMSSRP